MEIPDELACLFAGQIEQRDGTHVIEIPDQEITHGNIDPGRTYRVVVLQTESDRTETSEGAEQEPSAEHPQPPVEEGEARTVEIEGLGDQGDGIARVERGFVVIVPDTEQGERVAVEITDVRENVAFAEVTERLSYYD